MRKVRSDKKRDVKPTVSTYIRNNICTLANIVGLSTGDAGLILINRGFHNDDVMRLFQPLMISNFDINNRIYVGNRENGPVKINYRGSVAKVSIKFPAEIYEELRRLAFSIGLTPTTTAALMLRKGMFCEPFMDEQKRMYLSYCKSEDQKLELVRFIAGLENSIPKKKEVIR